MGRRRQVAPAARRAAPSVAWLLLGLLVASLPRPVVADDHDSQLQAKLKAVFVYRFLKYLTWPDEDRLDAYRVCVHGATQVAAPLEEIGRERTAKGRSVTVVRADSQSSFAGCHLLFLAGKDGLADNVAAATLQHVVTVGEDPAHASAGGAITFTTVSGRLRFRIHVGVLERAGVTASSQFLKLAIVEGANDPAPPPRTDPAPQGAP